MTPPVGESCLGTLLATLHTTLHPSTFVFSTFPPSSPPPAPLKDLAQLVFNEAEGTTLITTLQDAEKYGVEGYSFPSRMITCEVHSSLEAVGFMAVIAMRLAQKGMAVNPVSGFFHDHLFVPLGREGQALECLEELAEENRNLIQGKEAGRKH